MSKLKLFDYQVDIVKKMNELKNCFLIASTGSGKTIMSLYVVKNEKALIIVPNKKIKEMWEETITKFFPESKHVILTHYHIRNTSKLYKDFTALIVDEVHKMNSPKQQTVRRFKKQVTCEDFKFKILMSATPIKGSEIDFHTANRVYDLKKTRTQNEFYNYYFTFKKEYVYYMRRVTFVPYKFIEHKYDELIKEFNIIPFNRKINSETILIKIKKKHMTEYNEIKKFGVSKELLETYNAMTKVNILRQLSNSFWYDLPKQLVDNDYLMKIKAIRKIYDMHNCKIMVVICYKYHAKLITEIMSDIEFYDDEKEFENAKTGILLKNIISCESYDVFTTNTICFAGFSFSGYQFIQMKGRVTRVMSNFNKFYFYVLYFSNTIEKDVLNVTLGIVKKNDIIRKYEMIGGE